MRSYYWLVIIPFIGMLGGAVVFNQVTPYVLGLPFLLFWILLWIVLSSLTMLVIYQLDKSNGLLDKEGDEV
ncbi:DUF3311 domain-containing protein [Paenibacillus sp. GbtcB18]|uniref:DUF3311 domain-containing protein n=1 Tax=Paenibacillus TaxID=44249 RepID=UPI001C2F2909|nr:DUF3311 domain-containing protein [Paenibacillus sp. GbtcB18]